MEQLERILSILDHTLSSKKETSYCRRDSSKCFLIVRGLAFTVMTLKHDEMEEKEITDEQRYLE